jgi:hypothetical protein
MKKIFFHVFNDIINHGNCFNDFNSFLSRLSLVLNGSLCFQSEWWISKFGFPQKLRLWHLLLQISKRFNEDEVSLFARLKQYQNKNKSTHLKRSFWRKFKHQSCSSNINWRLMFVFKLKIAFMFWLKSLYRASYGSQTKYHMTRLETMRLRAFKHWTSFSLYLRCKKIEGNFFHLTSTFSFIHFPPVVVIISKAAEISTRINSICYPICIN